MTAIGTGVGLARVAVGVGNGVKVGTGVLVGGGVSVGVKVGLGVAVGGGVLVGGRSVASGVQVAVGRRASMVAATAVSMTVWDGAAVQPVNRAKKRGNRAIMMRMMVNALIMSRIFVFGAFGSNLSSFMRRA